MSTIISKALLFVPLDLTTPERMSNDWRDSTKNKAQSADEKRKAIVGNSSDYLNRLAVPASRGYSPYPSATFRSRSGRSRDEIINQHSKRIQATFSKYEAKLLRAFEEVEGEVAKRYKESVDNALDLYSAQVAQRTLPFTGEKTIGKSIAGIAPLWLTADVAVEGHIRGADQVQGGPVNVAQMTPADTRSALKAALAQQLVKGGVTILDGDLQPAVMQNVNDAINAIIKGLQDTVAFVLFTRGGASHCDYILVEGKLYLEIQVSIP